MKHGRLFRAALVLFVVVLCCALVVEPAWAGKKKKKKSGGKGVPAKTAEDAERDALAAYYRGVAEAWKKNAEARLPEKQADLQKAQDSFQQSSGELAALLEQAEQGRAKLEAAQERILDAAPDDSAYAQAEEAFEQARETLSAAQARVLGAADYQASYNAAKNSPDGATRLPQLRKAALEGDAAYRNAELKYRVAETLLNQAKAELFAADTEWVAITTEMRQTLVKAGEVKEWLEAYSKQRTIANLSVSSTVGLINKAADAIAYYNSFIKRKDIAPTYTNREPIRTDSGSAKP